LAPIWLYLNCDGLARGWAAGPCIRRGSPHVIGTAKAKWQTDLTAKYNPLFVPAKAWEQLQAEAATAKRKPTERIAEREEAIVVSVREDPVSSGRLVLLQIDYETEERYQRD
jgi:hypothetical protein